MVHHKNRYFTFSVEFADGQAAPTGAQAVIAQVRASIIDLHGDYGAGCTMPSLSLRFFDPSSGVCNVRVDREFAEMTRASIVVVTIIDKREVRLRVLHMAGSMRKCKLVLRKCLDAHLRKRLEGWAQVSLPPREKQNALNVHREAVTELDRTQL
ncbi:hypothetical protein T492DRAFT_1014183 [Pavlovales sp. CCMP2436]|nr:hypothetical protein T492DRAFT_1014183 [Pavlovales sp. CCMP2436]|mmetsp:Transcript_7444/g.19348  ORF Transcript_7444/g.19348 Transcript_7444/m.19348 type:complete len:154 (+) Transcript_7444:130-591(+)